MGVSVSVRCVCISVCIRIHICANGVHCNDIVVSIVCMEIKQYAKNLFVYISMNKLERYDCEYGAQSKWMYEWMNVLLAKEWANERKKKWANAKLMRTIFRKQILKSPRTMKICHLFALLEREYQPIALCRMYAHLVACTFICAHTSGYGLLIVEWLKFLSTEANSFSAIERISAMESKWNLYVCMESTQYKCLYMPNKHRHTHISACEHARARPSIRSLNRKNCIIDKWILIGLFYS